MLGYPELHLLTMVLILPSSHYRGTQLSPLWVFEWIVEPARTVSEHATP